MNLRSTQRSQRTERTRRTTESKGRPIRIGLCDLCDLLCVKFRSEKAIHTEIAKKATKRPDEPPEIERATQSEISVFATFAISVCKIPIRKADRHRDREEHKGPDEPPESKGHQCGCALRLLRSPCVKNPPWALDNRSSSNDPLNQVDDELRYLLQSDYTFTTMDLTSVYSSIASLPISRPQPDCL